MEKYIKDHIEFEMDENKPLLTITKGKTIDIREIIKDIEETRYLVEALIEYTDNLNEAIAYNTILNQHILSILVGDNRKFVKLEEKIRKKAKRSTRKGREQEEKDKKEFIKKFMEAQGGKKV